MKPWSVMSTVLLVDNKYLGRVLFGKPKCSSCFASSVISVVVAELLSWGMPTACSLPT